MRLPAAAFPNASCIISHQLFPSRAVFFFVVRSDALHTTMTCVDDVKVQKIAETLQISVDMVKKIAQQIDEINQEAANNAKGNSDPVEVPAPPPMKNPNEPESDGELEEADKPNPCLNEPEGVQEAMINGTCEKRSADSPPFPEEPPAKKPATTNSQCIDDA